MLKKIIKLWLRHKIVASALILAAIGGCYYGYQYIFSVDDAVRYVFTQVQKGTLIVSIAGSGQVSALNQVDIKPKVSGEIIAVYAKLGQEVGAGTILATIDAVDAARAVRDAETALETAKLELDKMLEPLDALTLLQAENSLAQTQESKQKAEDNLKKAYEDGFNTISNAFLNLPTVMSGLNDILYSSDAGLGGGGQWNIDYYANAVQSYDEKVLQYKTDVGEKYRIARVSYDKNFEDYKSVSRFSEREVMESLLDETYETTKNIAEAVRSANNLIQFYQDKLTERGLKPQALSNTHISSLNSYTSSTNNYLSGFLSAGRSLQDYKEAIITSKRSIEEKTLSLAKIKDGPEVLDIRAKKIAIQQREDALTTAKQALADHFVRSPFAGVIAKVNAKKGDTASAGTAIATVVTKQKIAEISLNEVDVAKIKVGQKATLTFDAVPDLTVAGQVAEFDAVGTVSQGVVTYNVKIAFDTQPVLRDSGATAAENVDERVKPGMSVSASIITEAKPNVLLAPNSSIKIQGNTQYAEMAGDDDRDAALVMNANGIILQSPLRQQIVEVGLVNDEFIEIISGLNEGDLIVIRTVQPSVQQSQTSTPQSGLRIPGLQTGGGGGVGR